MADRLSGGGAYEVEVVSSHGGPITMSNGLRLDTEPLRARSIDTLVVAGGIGTPAAVADEQLIAWVRRAAGRARRTASVCTGAFLLGEAGLLDGRRATTH